MGLLDRFTNMDETQTQGLLAAASQMLQQSGPSRTPQGFGQIVGGGMEAYQGATMAAKRRKMQEEQAALETKMYGMKMQGMESDLAAEAGKRDYDARLTAHLGQMGGGAASGQPQQAPQLGATPQASFPGMLQPMSAPAAPAQADQFQQRIARAAHLRTGGFHREADAAEVEALKFREELRTVDNGQSNDMVNPYTGEIKASMKKAQTLESVASERSAAASRTQSARQFDVTRAQQDRHHNDRENRERAAPRGQIIQTDQGPMLADPRTGTARPMTGADGSTLGPKSRPIPTQIQKAYVENSSSLRKVDAALAAVASYPDGLGVSNYLGDTIRQRSDPNGVNVRALVADIGSQKIHDRSGAAVTAAETPRLKPFIPASTDDPATVTKKLTMFKAEYQAIQTEMEELYSTDMGYKPLGKRESSGATGRPAATAEPKRKAALKGQTMGGYRFKGGDPSKQENWEQI